MPHNLDLLDWLVLGILLVQLALIVLVALRLLRLERELVTVNGMGVEGGGIGLPAPAPLLGGWYGYGACRAMADLPANKRATEGKR